MSASDDWAHQTSMKRATGSDAASMLSAQSSLAQVESEAEPDVAGAAKTLNEGVAGLLGGLTSLA